MADDAELAIEVAEERKKVKKMISEGKLKDALSKAKELEQQHVYTEKEFLQDAEEYGHEAEDLMKMLAPAWFVSSKPARKAKKAKRL
jgi:hypothetical protein